MSPDEPLEREEGANPRSRWRGVRFDSSGERNAVKLVYAIRLWDDDRMLDTASSVSAWTELQARVSGMTVGAATGNGRVPLWSTIDESNHRVHELAATVRQLVADGTIEVWHAGDDEVAALFGTRSMAWSLLPPGGRPPIPVVFRGIEFWGARYGIGYLVITIALDDGAAVSATAKGATGSDEDATDAFARYLDLISFSRHVGGRKPSRLRGTLLSGIAPNSAPDFCANASWRQSAGGSPSIETDFPTILSWALGRIVGDGARYSDLALENPHAARAYAFAFVDRVDPVLQCGPLVTQVVEMAHADRLVNRLVEDDHDGTGMRSICYAHDAYFAASRECTAFVAADQPASPFWRHGFPNHLHHEYFAVQILTLLQRHQLDELRRLIAVANQRGGEVWKQLESRAIEVKSRGFFVEVALRTNHARFEHMLRAISRIDRSYEVAIALVESVLEAHIARQQEIANESRERLRTQERDADRVLQSIAVLFLLPSLVLAFLNVNIRDITSEGDGLAVGWVFLWTGVSFGMAAAIAYLLPKLLRRASARDSEPPR
jgi:hypothetical protein